jgi:hypothetical protein
MTTTSPEHSLQVIKILDIAFRCIRSMERQHQLHPGICLLCQYTLWTMYYDFQTTIELQEHTLQVIKFPDIDFCCIQSMESH